MSEKLTTDVGYRIRTQAPKKRFRRFFKAEFLLIILPSIVSIRAWSFYAEPEAALWQSIEKITVFSVLGALFFMPTKKAHGHPPDQNSIYAKLIVLFSFTTWLPLYLYNDQSPISCLNYSYQYLYWMVFFILHRFRINRDDLLKFLLFAGIVWSSITIIQQFTYPRFLFFSRFDPTRPDPIEFRAGIYRYMIDGSHFGILTAFLALNRFLDLRKTRYLALTVLQFTGIYYFGTRQILFVSIASAAIMIIWYAAKKGSRLEIKFIFFLFAFFAAIAAGYEVIFKKLIDVTKEDATDDNVRLISYRYFLFEFWPYKLNFIFGNGIPKYDSEAGLAIRKLVARGLYQSDVGIVGTLSIYGILYTITSTIMLIHNALKRVEFKSAYIPIMFISIIFTIPLSAIFLSGSGAVTLSILMYLQDWARQDYRLANQHQKSMQNRTSLRW